MCGALSPSKVTVKEQSKKFAVKVELTASGAEQFREAKREEVDQMVTGLCVVGSRIFKARAIKWEFRDPDGKSVVKSTCEGVL